MKCPVRSSRESIDYHALVASNGSWSLNLEIDSFQPDFVSTYNAHCQCSAYFGWFQTIRQLEYVLCSVRSSYGIHYVAFLPCPVQEELSTLHCSKNQTHAKRPRELHVHNYSFTMSRRTSSHWPNKTVRFAPYNPQGSIICSLEGFINAILQSGSTGTSERSLPPMMNLAMLVPEAVSIPRASKV